MTLRQGSSQREPLTPRGKLGAPASHLLLIQPPWDPSRAMQRAGRRCGLHRGLELWWGEGERGRKQDSKAPGSLGSWS